VLNASSSSFPFFSRFSLGRALECDERFVPETVEPFTHFGQTPSVDCIESSRTFCPIDDEPSFLEDPKMLGHRWTGHLQPLRDLIHRQSSSAQTLEHGAPGRISERVKRALYVSLH
jgi:hypothetical protein